VTMNKVAFVFAAIIACSLASKKLEVHDDCPGHYQDESTATEFWQMLGGDGYFTGKSYHAASNTTSLSRPDVRNEKNESLSIVWVSDVCHETWTKLTPITPIESNEEYDTSDVACPDKSKSGCVKYTCVKNCPKAGYYVIIDDKKRIVDNDGFVYKRFDDTFSLDVFVIPRCNESDPALSAPSIACSSASFVKLGLAVIAACVAVALL